MTLQPLAARQAEITETTETLTTYPFSDPDPVAAPSHLYYPYFRFDGFTDRSCDRQWKVVKMENDYISLTIFPEIGGKIWGATDKTTGREFIYNNHVVKFRDVAMRGPWTSGGIEYNFGIIGHAPTCSTPVDYMTRRKDDGSVSCYISSYEFITRTFWTVEVNLRPDRAYFTTTTTWHNDSDIAQPYYQWMNAGYGIDGNAEFCYPGTDYIGHSGDRHPFPVDEEGHRISWYEKNNFGTSKSYHVLGKYNDYYGTYWHDHDFGSIHFANYDDKLGMKIWIWSLSREGAIWEDLLTDADGQYVELQSGRMFNQPASDSGDTPYKNPAFSPQATDRWTEYWFPVKGTRGVAKASPAGVLNVVREDGFVKLYFSPLQELETTADIYSGDRKIKSQALRCGVLETWKDSIPSGSGTEYGQLKVVIGDNLLSYSENPDDNITNRPKELPADFDWNSVYGLFSRGEQSLYRKELDKAESYLRAALGKDPYFVPALTAMASLCCRQGRYDEALEHCRTALSINSYDGETNYLYGLCNKALGHTVDAKDGFSVASYSPAMRSAAYEKLAELYLIDKDMAKAEHYAQRSLEAGPRNTTAEVLLALIYRKTGRHAMAQAVLDRILEEQPLLHAARFEKLYGQPAGTDSLTTMVRNELRNETYIELAEWYESVGCPDEAVALLSCAGYYPIALYRTAYILHKKGRDTEAGDLVGKATVMSPVLVFPFRPSTLDALQWANGIRPHWKTRYYEALIHWANGNKTKALELMDACGDDADYAAFYLSRASLKEGDAALADVLKAEQIQPTWRTGVALMNLYASMEEWQKAIETGRRYMKENPANYYVGLKYADALCEAGNYDDCIALLRRLKVVPNEGTKAGRAIYRNANLYKAMESIGRKKYRQAAKSIEAAGMWPENLGVGKPYDEMIDNRVEKYLEAQTAVGTGGRTAADALMAGVAAHAPSATAFRSADLLTALALRDAGNTEQADSMVGSWNERFPDNRAAQWCAAIYSGDHGKAASLLQKRVSHDEVAPWEASDKDPDFELIVRMLSR